MRGYYLWLIPCFQVALITAASDESEHVHIKVHIPDATPKHRVRQHQYRKQPQQQFHQHPGERPLHTSSVVDTHISSSPYEFDFLGLEEYGGRKNRMPEELRANDESFGPVLFNNDISASSVNTQHPMMSKQFMRQLFTPEMMSLLKNKEDTSHELNDVNGPLTDTNVASSISNRPVPLVDGSDLFTEYLQKLNEQQQSQITGPKFSSRISNKRKKNIYNEIGDQHSILQHHPKHQQEEQLDFEPYYSTSNTRIISPQYQTHHKQQISHQQFPQMSNPLHWADDDNSDEFETAEDISSSPSDSKEDMTTAFNKLQPISYQDMVGAYATPITSTTTTQKGHSYHQQTTEPTYSHPGNWRQHHNKEQYQHRQRPEVQQQLHYKQKQQQKQKQKSQQTQFVVPSTALRLTTSTSSSSSSSSPLSYSATSPISSGFTGGSITSTGTLPWILPYDFVQQSQQQQQYLEQQQKQQIEAQKHQHKLEKLPSRKKRKNRNKPKRTRTVVK